MTLLNGENPQKQLFLSTNPSKPSNSSGTKVLTKDSPPTNKNNFVKKNPK